MIIYFNLNIYRSLAIGRQSQLLQENNIYKLNKTVIVSVNTVQSNFQWPCFFLLTIMSLIQ